MQMDAGSYLLTTLGTVLITASVLATAALVHRVAPDARHHNARIFRFLGVFLLARATVALLAFGSFDAAHTVATAVAETLGYFVIVAVSGLAFFDLALAAVKIRPPTMVYELTMAVCYALTLMGVLSRTGFHATNLVATSAVATGILALSMQATLGNVVGGIALQLERSVRVGDWLQLDNGMQGLVREIRWRHTVFGTRDGDTVIVPNSALLAATFTILGGQDRVRGHRRDAVLFQVDVRTGPSEVIAAVERTLRASPIELVASEPAPVCVCISLNRAESVSTASYSARYWLTDLAQDESTRSRVRTRIHAALARAAIPLMGPESHLWLEAEDGERRRELAAEARARRLDAVRRATVLMSLHDEERAQVAERLRDSPFVVGEELTREGDDADWLYLIVSGTADVLMTDKDGRKRTAQVAGPTVIGEMGLITGLPRTATVIATSTIDAYRLDKPIFHDLLAKRPELADEIAAQIAVRARTQQSPLDDVQSGEDLATDNARLVDSFRRFFGLAGGR